MYVTKDSIIINTSPAQKEIIRNPKYALYIHGMIIDREDWDRPVIPIQEAENLITRLEKLKTKISDDPSYDNRRPLDVIDRIILNIKDGIKEHRNTFGSII